MPTAEQARDWLAHALAEDELAHYGVEGMKWGIRKDLDASGNRVSSDKTPSQTKSLKVTAKKDLKMQTGDKVVLGVYSGLGLLVGADAAKMGIGYLGAPLYKETIVEDLKKIEKYTAAVDNGKDFLNSKVNTNVPAGTTFHRVASYVESEVNAPKYATYLQDDVLRYRNSWITPTRTSWHPHYVTSMEALKPVTIASPDSIRNTIGKHVFAPMDDGTTLFDKFIKAQPFMNDITRDSYKDPKNFETLLDDIVHHNRAKIWGDEVGTGTSYWMQKAGYAAVTDINNTGVQSRKHAVIVLEKDAFKVTSRRLTQFERAAAAKAQAAILKAGSQKTATSLVNAGVSTKTATKAAKVVAKIAITRKL